MQEVHMSSLHLNTAVIGAGVGGAYAAYRLVEAKPNPNPNQKGPYPIGLFEFSNRIGGRLWSRHLPGMPHVTAPVGGMRFIRETQLWVASLIDYLGLPVCDFPMGNDNSSIGPNNNPVYLRGKRLRVGDLSNSALVPYAVQGYERNMNADQLQAYIMNLLVPNASKLSLSDWFKVKAFDKELYKYGLWNLIYKVCSSEAYAFMRDSGGYDTNVANSNAVSSLPTDDFAAGIKYQTLVGGYDQLPKTLVTRFQAAGGTLITNRRLKRIERPRRGGPLKLTFVVTVTDEDYKTVDDVAATQETVYADRVVLAMPRRSLELIEWSHFQTDATLMKNLRSVIMQPAFKIFLAYERPWWRDLGLQHGRFITDMPIRQGFYFGTEGEQPGADPHNLNSLLMASYSDLNSVPFWKAFEEDDGFAGYVPGKGEVKLGAHMLRHPHLATQSMIAEAHRQVLLVHGLKDVPAPYSAVYQDWSADPFGAAWHAWKAGFKYDDVIRYMRHPIASEPVYICGEAYSDQQGWVEGCRTAERMLQEHFGLSQPDWLPRDYDLGP
jgi:lysine 2-monooxygenase